MDKYPADVKRRTSAAAGDMRRRLIESAAHLVAEHGPAGLSARKVAAAAGTSTMAVYTHFGAMEQLVREVVEEGFLILERAFVEVGATDDAICDVAAQSAAMLEFAGEHAHLYAVIFGVVPLGDLALPPPSSEQRGRSQTLDRVAANLARAISDGRLREARAADLSFQWWSLVHGYAMLENAGFVEASKGRQRVLAPGLVSLFVGMGDDEKRAGASVGQGLAGERRFRS